ncbi:cysteine--tRNA ligase [Clostridium sp. CAG:302]|nr:cysteine--tRNA ligase [Clostridium sp. CAG:302]
MRIYNSLTDKVEEFKPINEGKVTMYVCGPTVYNYVHIGNMRPVITFDMVYKYLKYLGYDVKYASNYTDINPKITKAAEALGMTEREVANKFIKAYEEDLKNYNCSNIDYRPRVINYLDDIFNFISKLIEKDYAYVVDGDVYFRVSKIKDYGILSNQSIEELISGSRVDIDEKKENPLDFALWRKTTEGETFTSPWGEGIPGWHTECVVMINKLFGDKIDIHAGGVDLKFPHHENEIAQSIALNNNYIANYWMHNGHININNVKMSKSLNNFILAKDFIKEHSANVIKLAFLSTNYRQPLNLTDKVFDEALIIDNKIKTVLKSANNELNIKNIHNIKEEKDSTFEEYMNDDFNTPNVITLLLSLVKDLNQEIRNKGNNILTLTNKILTITNILGLSYSMPEFTEKQKETYNNWIKAREDKDFALADTLREKLVKENIL